MNKDVPKTMSADLESDCRQEVTEDPEEICDTSRFTTPDNHTFAWSVSERGKGTLKSSPGARASQLLSFDSG